MKSGSGDDPFAEPSSESTSSEPDRSPDSTATEPESIDSSPEIPYKFRRSSVKADRKQRPIFLRPHIEERESSFIRTLEDELGEDVYKTDALEAALVVAMDNPELVVEELREWGYDWD
ncbi:hypothetical protein [Haloarcula montana]|uniref:hypothetical protein n=1 Tax=Haloarcula montana TaxID=3111776 RepID=UPI002D76A158|nr:hypothetical protein [Haloarcula sp. GH36]